MKTKLNHTTKIKMASIIITNPDKKLLELIEKAPQMLPTDCQTDISDHAMEYVKTMESMYIIFQNSMK
jgi:hypothetical protein